MPGFGLARKAIEVFEHAKPSDGLILSKHGIVTFGESAREAYERMIEMVSLAEKFIERNSKTRRLATPLATRTAPVSRVAPIVRGACSLKDEDTRGRLAPAGARVSHQPRRAQFLGPHRP